MPKENDAFEARDLVRDYQKRHPIRTRSWGDVGVGIVEVLTDKPYAEWEVKPGVIVGVNSPLERSPRNRLAVNVLLEAAGLDHVPVEYSNTPNFVAL